MGEYIVHSYPPSQELGGADEVQGKFVKLAWQGKEYLLLSAKALHRVRDQMLAYFFADNRVPHRWIDEKTLQFDDKTISVTGSGNFRMAQSQKLLELWADNTQTFCVLQQEDVGEKLHEAGHPWSDATVIVR